jgi:hypothetical protein
LKTKKTVYNANFAIIAEGAQGVVKKYVRPADIRGEYGMCVVTKYLLNKKMKCVWIII